MSFAEVSAKYRTKGNFLDYTRLISIIPREYKRVLKNEASSHHMKDEEKTLIEDFFLKHRTKLTKFYYSKLISSNNCPTSQKAWENILKCGELSWKKYYMLTSKATHEVKSREFQYKILHRILPTNDVLFKMKIANDNKCTFCRLHAETLLHLFVECDYTQELWNNVERLLQKRMGNITSLSVQEKLFGTLSGDVVTNHIILITKRHIYYQRCLGNVPNILDLKQYQSRIVEIEYLAAKAKGKLDTFYGKWKNIH